MSKHIAFLSFAAALGLAALPHAASAADLYGYGDGGGDAPAAFHSREDVYLDGSRAHVVRRDDLGPDGHLGPEGYGHRRGPGPVVFDERGYRRYGGGYDDRGPRPGWGGERAAAFTPPYGYGEGWRPGPGFRPAAAFEGPDFGSPEGGCTVERARTITPAGWEKTVTHRTCYRR